MSNRVALNIRGVRFETFEETLSRFPNTLLGNPVSRAPFCNVETNEYSFNRSQYIFDTILFFYQSGGILAKPDGIDDEDFQDELRFFGIIKDAVAMDAPTEDGIAMQKKIHRWLEYPKISVAGKVFAAISLMTIIVSTATYCLETEKHLFEDNIDRSVKIGDLQAGSAWLIFESIYAVWFSLEYILRLFSHPHKKSFVISVLGLVDLSAIIPYLIIVFLIQHNSEAAIRLFRFLQIFRILKLTRYSKSLQLLGKSLCYCKGQITLLLIFFSINCLACGSILYWIERNTVESRENSIMDTMWFCVISMTTVGYGDIVPHTTLGKLMGTVTILTGIVILFHIFIPVYLSYFALLYELSCLNQVERNELEKEQDNIEEKVCKKMSDASSVRRPRNSVSNTRSPSVSARDNFSPSRKLSVMKEESVMLKIKYDYLRKISVTEAPVDITRKASTAEFSSNERLLPTRSPVRRMFVLDSPNETEEIEGTHFDFAQKDPPRPMPRGRRKAVIDQPNICIEEYEQQNLIPKPCQRTVKSGRSISMVVNPTSFIGRKYSSDNNVGKDYLQVPRKSLSLQWFHDDDDVQDDDTESIYSP